MDAQTEVGKDEYLLPKKESSAIPNALEELNILTATDLLNVTPGVLQSADTKKRDCKLCHSVNIVRLRRTGWKKAVLSLMNSYRYYCYNCGNEFVSKRNL